MRRVAFTVLLVVGFVAVQAVASPNGPQAHRSPMIRAILQMDRGIAPTQLPNGRFMPMPSGGLSQTVQELLGTPNGAVEPAGSPPTIGIYGCSHTFKKKGFPDNVRANVDCGFRFQGEEWVAANPTDPSNVIVSQNDSKLSGNRTGIQSPDSSARRSDESGATQSREPRRKSCSIWSWCSSFSCAGPSWKARRITRGSCLPTTSACNISWRTGRCAENRA